jgi:ferredoxin
LVAVTINGHSTQAAEGTSLFDCAGGIGIPVPTSCRKQGKCKECIVEVTEGLDHLTDPTEQERHLKGSFRLSCQARVNTGAIRCHTMRRANLRIERHAFGLPLGRNGVLEPAVTRDGERILIDGVEIARGTGSIHGIAMDLGTTTIVLRLFDLESGEQIADTSFENPQRFGGSDVMARISYDGEHRGLLMRTLAGYLTRAIEEFPVDPRSIYEMVVVGNSTMRDLFFGLSVYSFDYGDRDGRGEAKYYQPDLHRTALPPAHPSGRAGLRCAHYQRARGRGCGGLHASGGYCPRRPPDRGDGHRHQYRVDPGQPAPHPGGILSSRPGLRRRGHRVWNAGAGRRD